MKGNQSIGSFQWKILFYAKLKLILSVLSALFIPLFFSAASVHKALWNIDTFMVIPVIILFAELYYLELYYGTSDIVYCTVRRKSGIFFIRCGIIYALLLLMAAVVLLIYYLMNPNLRHDANNSVRFLLSGLYAYICTSVFFGAFSCTVTNLTHNNFMGIGASLGLFAMYYFVDFFKRNTILSMFVFQTCPLWRYAKLFYLGVGIVLLVCNDRLIGRSLYDSVWGRRKWIKKSR